jgi:threonine/homoserine/homoserine lactone efflux protein
MLLAVGTFTVAAVLIVLLPGPDTLVVVRNIVRGGRRRGVLTAVGNLCGLVIWVVAATLGLAAALRASETGYEVLRVAGALYLAWLGIQAWRSRGRVTPRSEGRRGLLGGGFPAGLLTNLLNPKVGVFFVAFLLTAIYWIVLLRLAATVTDWMNTPRIRRRLDLVTGTMLIAFGVRLATES